MDNLLFVCVFECVACICTLEYNREPLEYMGFVMCSCTAYATLLKEREQDACSSLLAQFTPCWAVHPQLKPYSYCPLEVAVYIYTCSQTHAHAQWAQTVCFGIRRSKKKMWPSTTVIFVIRQWSTNFWYFKSTLSCTFCPCSCGP